MGGEVIVRPQRRRRGSPMLSSRHIGMDLSLGLDNTFDPVGAMLKLHREAVKPKKFRPRSNLYLPLYVRLNSFVDKIFLCDDSEKPCDLK